MKHCNRDGDDALITGDQVNELHAKWKEAQTSSSPFDGPFGELCPADPDKIVLHHVNP
jgi:hypothetical protein